jgi:hypothetical protein
MKYIKQLIAIIFLNYILCANAQQWQDVSGGINQWVNAMEVDTANNLLYVGGLFTTAGGLSANSIAVWNGTTWQAIGNNEVFKNPGSVTTIAFLNGDIVVGGLFDSVGNIRANNVARFDGLQWHSMDSGFDNQVSSLHIFNGELYAGGGFFHSGSTLTPDIAKWNGSNWEYVPGSLSFEEMILDMKVFDNKLYLAQLTVVRAWDGIAFTTLGNAFNDNIVSLNVFQNELYACGFFTASPQNPCNYLGRWDGSTWQPMPHPAMIGAFPEMFSVQEFHNQFFVAGTFNSPPRIARYNGIGYDSICNSFSGVCGLFAIYNDELYVAGIFTAINQVSMLNIARFDDANEIREPQLFSNELEVFPNPLHNNEDLKIKLLNSNFHSASIKIYDSFGELIYSDRFYNDVIKIKTEKFSAGICFLSVTLNDMSKISKKIIIIP